jgi:hypothetical protein
VSGDELIGDVIQVIADDLWLPAESSRAFSLLQVQLWSLARGAWAGCLLVPAVR